jgi:hypothetical protein
MIKGGTGLIIKILHLPHVMLPQNYTRPSASSKIGQSSPARFTTIFRNKKLMQIENGNSGTTIKTYA